MALHSHTRRVAFLRILFPVIAVIGVIALFLWPALKEFQQERLSRLSITRAKIEKIALSTKPGQVPQLQVTKPQFDGRDETGRPYRITATRVLQGLRADAPMTLEHPVAILTLDPATRRMATLRGDHGLYDPQNKTLALDRNITLVHSDGYTLWMQDLFIDLNAGSSVTKTPVSGKGPMGELQGESLELRDKGNRIILHGKSKLILNMQKTG